jgi:hypothetical protein
MLAGYSSSSCSIRPASATNASTAIITTVVNETAIVGMSSVLWVLQLLSQLCLPTISSVLYNTNPPLRRRPNLNCYAFCNERATTSVPHAPLASLALKPSVAHIVLNGKRAARQQGDPFSMGGSSNGGKAIGTLWCKSMFASGWCQDTIPANRKCMKLLHLR